LVICAWGRGGLLGLFKFRIPYFSPALAKKLVKPFPEFDWEFVDLIVFVN
jgi:hypothetical protein